MQIFVRNCFVFLIFCDHRSIFGVKKKKVVCNLLFFFLSYLNFHNFLVSFLIKRHSGSWAYWDWFLPIFTDIWLFPCVKATVLSLNVEAFTKTETFKQLNQKGWPESFTRKIPLLFWELGHIVEKQFWNFRSNANI